MYLPQFNGVLMCLYGSSCHVTLSFTVERLRDQLVDSKNRVSNRLNSLDDAVLECRHFNQQADDIQRWYTQFADVIDSQPDVVASAAELLKAQEEQKVGDVLKCQQVFLITCLHVQAAGHVHTCTKSRV